MPERSQPQEQLLHGGTTNAGLVSRIGDTVRRPLRPTSAATHALLRHLQDVGFAGSPRLLGVDDAGREVLGYIEGSAAIDPAPAWALTDEALTGVAELLRSYHAAVKSFDPSAYVWPHAVHAPFNDGIVSHNDLNLDNVIFRNRRPVALIDFDLASPGSAVWDVANALLLWAPLRHEHDIDDDRRDHVLHRLEIFVRAYGLSSRDRERVADAVVATHDWCHGIVRAAVTRGHSTFTAHWRHGGEQIEQRSRAWLLTNLPEIRERLTHA